MATSSNKSCSTSTTNMSTKELARSLGLIQKLSSSTKKSGIIKLKKQPFTYLVVIDFESTCWKDKKMSYAPEIIEFPAVLMHTSTGVIESEFHHYVQPSEHQRLSEFCRELTGITQSQVNDGIPVGTCLMLFNNWLRELIKTKNIKFLSDVLKPAEAEQNSKIDVKWCTFVTWSDWDIGICLKNECQRKRHLVPQPLRSWIDLRSTYRTFYSRKPNGLAGALKDLGIQFSGRQHSGLDDARNTATLACRMIKDGCIMNVTSSIDASVSLLHQIIQNGFKRNQTKEADRCIQKSIELQHSGEENYENQPRTNSCVQKTDSLTVNACKTIREMENPRQETNSVPQRVVEPALGEHAKEKCFECTSVSRGEDLMQKVSCTSVRSLLSPTVSVTGCTCKFNIVSAKTESTRMLVAPVTCLTSLTGFTSQRCPANESRRPIGGENIAETTVTDATLLKRKSRDVDGPIAGKRGLVTQTLGMRSSTTSSCSSRDGSSSVKSSSCERLVTGHCFTAANTIVHSKENINSNNMGLKRHCKGPNVSEFNSFKTPRLVDRSNMLSNRPLGVLTNERASGSEKTLAPLSIGAGKTFKASLQNGTKETQNQDKDRIKFRDPKQGLFKTPKAVNSLRRASVTVTPMNNSNVTQYSTVSKKVAVTPKPPNTFNKYPANVTPKNSESRNRVTPSSTFIKTPMNGGGVTPVLRFNGGSVTPPLCQCGRRARRLTVGKPGPNQGRVFYACSVRNNRSSFGKSPLRAAKVKKNCKFFCWEPKGLRNCSLTQRTIQGTVQKLTDETRNIGLSIIWKP